MCTTSGPGAHIVEILADFCGFDHNVTTSSTNPVPFSPDHTPGPIFTKGHIPLELSLAGSNS